MLIIVMIQIDACIYIYIYTCTCMHKELGCVLYMLKKEMLVSHFTRPLIVFFFFTKTAALRFLSFFIHGIKLGIRGCLLNLLLYIMSISLDRKYLDL
jgi:hypothetical protein